ncbi:MAG: putative metalloprotease with PDZ domain [Planctomycetota bacterium]
MGVVCTREFEGEAVEFGTTGYTMNNIFVLYDRSSDSVWYPTSNESFEAVSGERKGDLIEILAEPAPVMLGEWLDKHPASVVLLPTAEDLARREEMRNRPFMGVQLENGDESVSIGSVTDGGPAETAGIQAGDRLISFDGVPIDSMRALREFMSEHAPGDVIEVLLERSGKEQRISLKLGSRG